jgi:hypothetical protein
MSTNLGPVTTIFTPPSSCLATTTAAYDDPYYFAWINYFGIAGGGESCYPGGSPSGAAQTNGAWDNFYYSPAVCPSGWMIVSSLQITESNDVTMNAGTSRGLCCPR